MQSRQGACVVRPGRPQPRHLAIRAVQPLAHQQTSILADHEVEHRALVELLAGTLGRRGAEARTQRRIVKQALDGGAERGRVARWDDEPVDSVAYHLAAAHARR